MAEMKPFGVDQTTGQERPVANDDNLTNETMPSSGIVTFIGSPLDD